MCWAEDDDLETKWWAVFRSRSSSAFPPAAAGIFKGMVVSYEMPIRRRILSIPPCGAMCSRGEISAQREMVRFRRRYSLAPSATADRGAGFVWGLVVPVAKVGP